jgi:hypothetical protein
MIQLKDLDLEMTEVLDGDLGSIVGGSDFGFGGFSSIQFKEDQLKGIGATINNTTGASVAFVIDGQTDRPSGVSVLSISTGLSLDLAGVAGVDPAGLTAIFRR